MLNVNIFSFFLLPFFLHYIVYTFKRRAGQHFIQRLPLVAIFFSLLLACSSLYVTYSPEFWFYMDREDLCIHAVGHISEPVYFEIGPPARVTCKDDDGNLVELIPSWVGPAISFLRFAIVLAFLAVIARRIWRGFGRARGV